MEEKKKGVKSHKLPDQFQHNLWRIFINLGAKYNYSTAAVYFFPSLIIIIATNQVFILAGNTRTSLHSNREQLLAAPLNFRVLSAPLKTGPAACI